MYNRVLTFFCKSVLRDSSCPFQQSVVKILSQQWTTSSRDEIWTINNCRGRRLRSRTQPYNAPMPRRSQFLFSPFANSSLIMTYTGNFTFSLAKWDQWLHNNNTSLVFYQMIHVHIRFKHAPQIVKINSILNHVLSSFWNGLERISARDTVSFHLYRVFIGMSFT